jgi:putative phosphoribosyl transferase
MAYTPDSFRVIDGTIPTRGANLPALLTLPPEPVGVVVFAHGSGSSRNSPRNQAVAHILNASHIATVLFDLLTPEEDTAIPNRFDIELLTWRLVRAVEWARDHPFIPNVPIGLFGASTGAAAAIKAATLLGETISAVVSRGGRPDISYRRGKRPRGRGSEPPSSQPSPVRKTDIDYTWSQPPLRGGTIA